MNDSPKHDSLVPKGTFSEPPPASKPSENAPSRATSTDHPEAIQTVESAADPESVENLPPFSSAPPTHAMNVWSSAPAPEPEVAEQRLSAPFDTDSLSEQLKPPRVPTTTPIGETDQESDNDSTAAAAAASKTSRKIRLEDIEKLSFKLSGSSAKPPTSHKIHTPTESKDAFDSMIESTIIGNAMKTLFEGRSDMMEQAAVSNGESPDRPALDLYKGTETRERETEAEHLTEEPLPAAEESLDGALIISMDAQSERATQKKEREGDLSEESHSVAEPIPTLPNKSGYRWLLVLAILCFLAIAVFLILSETTPPSVAENILENESVDKTKKIHSMLPQNTGRKEASGKEETPTPSDTQEAIPSDSEANTRFTPDMVFDEPPYKRTRMRSIKKPLPRHNKEGIQRRTWRDKLPNTAIQKRKWDDSNAEIPNGPQGIEQLTDPIPPNKPSAPTETSSSSQSTLPPLSSPAIKKTTIAQGTPQTDTPRSASDTQKQKPTPSVSAEIEGGNSGENSQDDLSNTPSRESGESPHNGRIEDTLPETPSKQSIAQDLSLVQGEIERCAAGKGGVVKLDLTLRNSGRVSHVVVSGDFAGSSQGSCIARVVRKAQFSRFKQATFRLKHSLSLP